MPEELVALFVATMRAQGLLARSVRQAPPGSNHVEHDRQYEGQGAKARGPSMPVLVMILLCTLPVKYSMEAVSIRKRGACRTGIEIMGGSSGSSGERLYFHDVYLRARYPSGSYSILEGPLGALC